MEGAFDQSWIAAVVAACDPVFAAAEVGFVRQFTRDGEAVKAILWEANAIQFAERYPDSGVLESYGEAWPAPCIDYWVYLNTEAMEACLSVEGWGLRDEVVHLSGDGEADSLTIASAMARILRVSPPRD